MAEDLDKDKVLINQLKQDIILLKKENSSLKMSTRVCENVSSICSDPPIPTPISINKPADQLDLAAVIHSEAADNDGEGDFTQVIHRRKKRRSYADVVKTHGEDASSAHRGVKSQHGPVCGPKKPKNIHVRKAAIETVSIGTSLVDGLGNQLNQLGTEATVFKYSGAEIPRIRENIPRILPKEKYAERDIRCLLQVAGNDASSVPASAVIGRYEDLINDVLSQCPKAEIITCRIPPRRYRNNPAKSQLTMDRIEQVNTYLLTRSIMKGDIFFIDTCPKTSEYFEDDHIHFNKKGKLLNAQKMHMYLSGFHRVQSEKIT